jgi:hypothetical protein
MMESLWLCRHCGFGAKIQIFDPSPKDDGSFISKRWLCHSCGTYGWVIDSDAPIQITEDVYDKYWEDFQTDLEFIPADYKKI